MILYSPHYDIHFFGLERMHPFDSCKYGRAWRELNRTVGPELKKRSLRVDRPASDSELRLAHSAAHLEGLRSSQTLARALELPFLRRAPAWLLRWRIVQPMLWAVRGTILAAEAALQHGWAANLSGGYHHAKPDRSEGFCLFSDIAIAVRALRASAALKPPGRIVYIDLDAHQGNGVCHQFMDDPEVFIFDMYNSWIYPTGDSAARGRIDCDVPLDYRSSGDEYLSLLRAKLPAFLDSVSRTQEISLAIYNAGTDVVSGDPLGGLDLSASDVLARDLFVIQQCRDRGIPAVLLPSGGYTRESFRLIAATLAELLNQSDP